MRQLVSLRKRAACEILRQQVQFLLQLAGAVGEGFGLDAEAVQHVDKQIRDRRSARRDVAAAAQSAGVAGKHQRQIEIRVRVAVAQRAAVKNRGMIEQGAVAVRVSPSASARSRRTTPRGSS